MHLVLCASGRPIITFAVYKFMAHSCHLKGPIRLDLERFAISPRLGRGTVFARVGVETLPAALCFGDSRCRGRFWSEHATRQEREYVYYLALCKDCETCKVHCLENHEIGWILDDHSTNTSLKLLA